MSGRARTGIARLVETGRANWPTWGLWIGFETCWQIAARSAEKRVRAREPATSRAALRTRLTIAFVLLGLPAGRFNPRLPGQAALRPVWLAIQVLGMAWSFWARMHLGRYWSGRIAIKANQRVIATGPYRLVRHPIYTGILTQMLGSSLYSGTVASLLALLLLYVSYRGKARKEERMLLHYLGDEYARYRKQVHAALLPGVHAA